jgi:hypothetical protein
VKEFDVYKVISLRRGVRALRMVVAAGVALPVVAILVVSAAKFTSAAEPFDVCAVNSTAQVVIDRIPC